MLKEKAFWSSIIGFFAVSLVGTVNHFVYGLSGNNPIVGLFTPVNESVWEHLKLLFFPFMLYTIVEWLVYGRNIKGFLFSRCTGVIGGLILIPTAFYVYTAVIGRNFAPLDILIFFTAVLMSFYISLKRINQESDTSFLRSISAVILFLGITALFIGLTFFPPDTALFRNPM